MHIQDEVKIIMSFRFRSLSLHIHGLWKLNSSLNSTSNPFIQKILVFPATLHLYHEFRSINFRNNHKSTAPDSQNSPESTSVYHEAHEIQSLLKIHADGSKEEIAQRLDECNISLSEEVVLNVLERHRSDWKLAYAFFNWVCKVGFSPGPSIYNEIVNTLGRMRRFDEVRKVFDEMSSRKKLINEHTYAILVSRFAAAHKVDEAIALFNKMENFGLERNLAAFQTLLLALCRYKHVEEAELLFRNKKTAFANDIKTWNIILNGWCVLRSLRDAKRFWNDVVTSDCKLDMYTYGIFINALSKSGKTSTAMKLLKTMWDKGLQPDVAICNAVIDGLCFKKRIPEALEIFREMKAKDCHPSVATYNSLIKHLCKIQRMEKVDELLNEMKPNAVTYGYLLKSVKSAEEVDKILEEMEKSGCKMEGDTYNLLLRLFMEWGDQERAKFIWDEMERCGVGHDQRSYTIVVHGLYNRGMMRDALELFNEMVSKGMVPEPRTKLLVDDMNRKLRDGIRSQSKKNTR